MAGGQFFTRLHATSRSSLVKPTRPFFNNPTKNYGQASNVNRSRGLMEEKAPSTAEEFERVAEEKARKNQEGVANQTADKSHDDAEQPTTGDSKAESVKNKNRNRYKEH